MNKGGTISIVVKEQHEAKEFKLMLEEQHNFRVDYILVKDQLQEIPEENIVRGQQCEDQEYEKNGSLQLDCSEGALNSS
jgi:uncharacterized membrane protein YcaP (DUF421 family)